MTLPIATNSPWVKRLFWGAVSAFCIGVLLSGFTGLFSVIGYGLISVALAYTVGRAVSNVPKFRIALRYPQGMRKVVTLSILVGVLIGALSFQYMMGVNCDVLYDADQDVCVIRMDDNVIVMPRPLPSDPGVATVTRSSFTRVGRYWQLTGWVAAHLTCEFVPPGSMKLEAFGHRIVYVKNTLLLIDKRSYPLAPKWWVLHYASPKGLIDSLENTDAGIIRIPSETK